MRKPKKKMSNQLQQKMHVDDILNKQFQLRLSSRITALDIPPVALKLN